MINLNDKSIIKNVFLLEYSKEILKINSLEQLVDFYIY